MKRLMRPTAGRAAGGPRDAHRCAGLRGGSDAGRGRPAVPHHAPNGLLAADSTYVPLTTGTFCYIAFMFDAFAGRILGWQC